MAMSQRDDTIETQKRPAKWSAEAFGEGGCEVVPPEKEAEFRKMAEADNRRRRSGVYADDSASGCVGEKSLAGVIRITSFETGRLLQASWMQARTLRMPFGARLWKRLLSRLRASDILALKPGRSHQIYGY